MAIFFCGAPLLFDENSYGFEKFQCFVKIKGYKSFIYNYCPHMLAVFLELWALARGLYLYLQNRMNNNTCKIAAYTYSELQNNP